MVWRWEEYELIELRKLEVGIAKCERMRISGEVGLSWVEFIACASEVMVFPDALVTSISDHILRAHGRDKVAVRWTTALLPSPSFRVRMTECLLLKV